MTIYSSYSRRNTPQSRPLPGSTQVMNNAGGFTWQIDPWQQLDRFLILGSEGGTYYVSPRKLTVENAENVLACIKEDGARTVLRIAEISRSGRAPSNDPAIFALALCFAYGDSTTKALSSGILPDVCRIGTHLFHFATYVTQHRGWGRSLKNAVKNWYDRKNEMRLAQEVTKYQSRDGWSHRDLIRLSHPKRHSNVYSYVTQETLRGEGDAVDYINAVEVLKEMGQRMSEPSSEAIDLIVKYRLPREVIPTHWLNTASTWEVLLPHMGMEALVRNLGNMSKVGLIKPLSSAVNTVVDKLSDAEAIHLSRIHPIKILVGQRQYAKGHGDKGHGEWPVTPQIVDALEAAFYTSFEAIEPSGKNFLLGLDVSGSMKSPMGNLPLTFCEAAAVMCMVTARTESNYYILGFNRGMVNLGITAGDSLESATRKANQNNMGGTDAAVAMDYALREGLDVDGFVIYTDNETWAGRKHASVALQEYRNKLNKPETKLVVVGMAGNRFSIADPTDPGMLDVVGFDTSTPAVISDFVR